MTPLSRARGHLLLRGLLEPLDHWSYRPRHRRRRGALNGPSQDGALLDLAGPADYLGASWSAAGCCDALIYVAGRTSSRRPADLLQLVHRVQKLRQPLQCPSPVWRRRSDHAGAAAGHRTPTLLHSEIYARPTKVRSEPSAPRQSAQPRRVATTRHCVGRGRASPSTIFGPRHARTFPAAPSAASSGSANLASQRSSAACSACSARPPTSSHTLYEGVFCVRASLFPLSPGVVTLQSGWHRCGCDFKLQLLKLQLE
jgi:hypothetical protein